MRRLEPVSLKLSRCGDKKSVVKAISAATNTAKLSELPTPYLKVAANDEEKFGSGRPPGGRPPEYIACLQNICPMPDGIVCWILKAHERFNRFAWQGKVLQAKREYSKKTEMTRKRRRSTGHDQITSYVSYDRPKTVEQLIRESLPIKWDMYLECRSRAIRTSIKVRKIVPRKKVRLNRLDYLSQKEVEIEVRVAHMNHISDVQPGVKGNTSAVKETQESPTVPLGTNGKDAKYPLHPHDMLDPHDPYLRWLRLPKDWEDSESRFVWAPIRDLGPDKIYRWEDISIPWDVDEVIPVKRERDPVKEELDISSWEGLSKSESRAYSEALIRKRSEDLKEYFSRRKTTPEEIECDMTKGGILIPKCVTIK